VTGEQTLALVVHSDDADDQALDDLAQTLRNQLLQLDVDAVEPLPDGEAPEGSKAIDLVVIGGLLVRFGPDVANAVANVVKAFVKRDEGRSVTLKVGDREITVQAATAEQQDKLVDALIADLRA
jgi:hypothetical protein